MFGLTPYTKSRGLSRTDDFVDFYNMIDGFFNDSLSPFRSLRQDTFRVDLKESPEEYHVDAELPGLSKEDIRLDFDDGKLLISVSKQEEKNQENSRYIHRERSYQSMQRGVYLPNASGESIQARFENGILHVSIPKTKVEEKKTQIQID